MSALAVLLSARMVAETVRMAVPYAAAATGGVWSEKSGVVNIALEGKLLVGGLASIAVTAATGRPWAGLVAGVLAGMLVGLLHVIVVEYGRASAIVSGLAINVLAAAGSRFALRALYDSSSNSPAVAGFEGFASAGPGVGRVFAALVDPTTVTVAVFVLASAFAFVRTPFGLHVRAAGAEPRAARSAGLDVRRIRLVAVTLAGAVTGLGGVALAFDQHQFQSGMSGGRGYIALAAVILSRWRPLHAAAFAFAFAVLDAVQIVLQDQDVVPTALVQTLPYVATLVVLAGMARARTAATQARAL
ncbi:MAG: ABC transporter permease [Polyangiaceae bacterium]